jgi:hypothetical protein
LEVDERRELYSGFGNSLTWAVEFAATPLLFGLIGHFLDGVFGTSPWLAIVLVVFAISGLVVRTYYGYVAAMEAHEANAPWRRKPRPEGQPVTAGADPALPGGGTIELAEEARLPRP